MSVLSGFNLEKMQGLFPGTKKTVRNTEGSVYVKRGLTVLLS